MKKFILFLFLIPVFTFAQSSFYGGAGHFSAGTIYLNMSTVNNYISKQALPEFSGNCLTIGGGGFAVINNFIIGGEGCAISASRVGNSSGSAEFGTGMGLFSFGYAIPSYSRMLIYPLGGIGWGGSSLKINLNEQKTEYNAGKFFFDAGIRADFFMIGGRGSDAKGGFKAGIALGYLFNPQAQPWQDKDKNYTSIPNTFTNGFYVKLQLGGGGIVSK